jgi:capsule polysaccharide export protein KpsE/RkpR
MEILNSRRCLGELVVKFGLMERDNFRFMEDAIKDFRENKLQIKIEKLSVIMYIGVYDKDPTMAKQMVEFLLKQLDKINIELNVANARNNREYIEKRYFQSREDLTKAEDSLESFQHIYGIAPDIQVKAAAQTVFAIESELKAEEVKLDVLKKILSSEQPEIKTQEAKVNSLKSKVVEIQESTDISDMLRLGNSPHIVLSYLRLQREVEIQTKILTFLLPIYEQAKIEEKRETPTILVLDTPVIAERKSKPKRLTMVVVWTILGFGFGCFFIVAREKVREIRKSVSKISKSIKVTD